MNLAAGARLGPYEIIEKIGTGGMGEVYKARDTRLGREVATKISSERFSERFEREARAIASLNHPNVCQLYDVGDNYLVMELVEGDAPQGPLPLETALNYARQIADALAAAHEKGIVHRDLKPANIKIKPDGQVKVLDFGLAKVGWTNSAPDLQNSPTLSLAATQAGMILGTAGYMAPEQAKGRSVDKRADIWAFGVVLYEMLRGRPLFEGDDVTEVLASVVKDQPDLTQVPFQVRRLLSACLEKDPNRRLRDIGDVWKLLDDAPVEKVKTAVQSSRFGARKYAWIAVIALVLLALIPANVIHWRESSPALPEVARFQITAPEKSRFFNTSPLLSPDGRKLVFEGSTEDGSRHLWVRSLDTFDAKNIADLQGPAFAFWSPDSRYIGYYDRGKLWKVEAAGGTPQDICDVPTTIVGGAWSPEGVIVFGNAAFSSFKGLYKVAANGGTPSQLTSIDASKLEGAHILPYFLPDGRHFVYVRFSLTSVEKSGTYVGSIDDVPDKQSTQMVVPNHATIQYSPSLTAGAKQDMGYLVYLRESTLVAHAFDTRAFRLIGDPIRIADPVGRSANDTIGFFSISQTGSLIYRAGNEAGSNQLTWLDRHGTPISDAAGPFTAISEPGSYSELNLSRDMHNVVVSSGGAARRDIYVFNFVRSLMGRLISDPSDDRSPIWSPDGLQVVFSSARDGQEDLYIKPSNGATNEEVLYKSPGPKTATDWSKDGRFLLFTTSDAKTKTDIWYLPMTGERKAMPFLQGPSNEGLGQFSPDGRYVVYLSDESGATGIYVRTFPDPNEKWQISKTTGVDPRWRADGKEIIYLSNRKVMAVEVTLTPKFVPGTQQELFEAPIVNAGSYGRNPGYSVTADGKAFLVNMPIGPNASRPINVVLNWQSALKN
jgi:serine/threonine protein kinase